ncbi:MAG: hypothetical protein JNM78_15855 [Cyclobacteriaceae bacterium]|nr:hypothetical protein [Cyclobacteriaceae bacterium]
MDGLKIVTQKIGFIISLSGLSFLSPISSAQTLDDFNVGKNEYYGNGHWGLALSFSSLSNSAAPNPSSHRVTGFTLKIDYKKYNLGKGGKRMFFQNKTIGDMIFILGSEITSGKGAERAENSALSTGLIGWTSWGWNVLANGKSSVAIGFNLNDYILGSTYVYTDAQGQKLSPITTEPQGYYWGGGPSLFFDYQISEKLNLQSFASYSFSFWRPVSLDYATKDNSYEKPHFMEFNVELQTKFQVYGGVDFTTLINRGDLPNRTKRFDIIVGYRF